MKKVFFLLLAAMLTCSLATGEAWARGGGGGGGGGHGGGGHGGGGYGGGYGRGYGGYGYGGYGYGGIGLGYGLGYGYGGYPGYYGGGYGGYDNPYPIYNNYSAPPAYTVPMAPAQSYNSYYYAPSIQPTAPPSNAPGYYASNAAPVQLEVLVPDSRAQVWVDGQPTTTQGLDRIFTTTPLEAGYTYAYNVKVAWNQAGHDVVVERKVQVTPGQLNRVDFSKTDVRIGASALAP